MKKIIIATVVCFTLLFSSVSQAAAGGGFDPKLKMMATMAGYGVVGGALLGTATLAFGAGGRSIAKGASLGLYAGLIFGGYIIFNYEMKKRGYQESKGDYYPESNSPYENNDRGSIEKVELQDYRLAQFENKKDPKSDPLFFMNFLKMEF
ncbi:MAG: hypothetical protein H7177_16710 [Rhizobacter sp.]|nr:hypothetical protein [Bacteriovorax sp.]